MAASEPPGGGQGGGPASTSPSPPRRLRSEGCCASRMPICVRLRLPSGLLSLIRRTMSRHKPRRGPKPPKETPLSQRDIYFAVLNERAIQHEAVDAREDLGEGG